MRKTKSRRKLQVCRNVLFVGLHACSPLMLCLWPWWGAEYVDLVWIHLCVQFPSSQVAVPCLYATFQGFGGLIGFFALLHFTTASLQPCPDTCNRLTRTQCGHSEVILWRLLLRQWGWAVSPGSMSWAGAGCRKLLLLLLRLLGEKWISAIFNYGYFLFW